jgi:acyl carrier protein
MNERLLNCFRSVFPTLSDGELQAASVETVSAWDSVAAITLVNVIEDEFGIQMDYEVAPELTSFDAVRNYVATLYA